MLRLIRFGKPLASAALRFAPPAVAESQGRPFLAILQWTDALSGNDAYARNRSFASDAFAIEEKETKDNYPASDPTQQQIGVMPHPGLQADAAKQHGKLTEEETYMLMHPVYTKEYVESIVPQHRKPRALHDWTGLYGVRMLRSLFDLATGYGHAMTEKKWLTRFLFLETVAGVPGMVAAGLRHMRSLRTMKRDNGWIHTLLEEAENERMHLLTFMQMANPGFFFRASVLGAQGVFLTLYTAAYALSPRHCHAFVAYLEEEAVLTYTKAISDLDAGKLPSWSKMIAPDIARNYWRLEPGASMRDLLLAVRADEACHKHVNATFAELKGNDPNPFAPGTTMIA